MSKPASFPPCLPKSPKEQIAREDGTGINRFIVMAAGRKLAAMDTGRFFSERAGRADLDLFWRGLDRSGGEPPRDGDELPAACR